MNTDLVLWTTPNIIMDPRFTIALQQQKKRRRPPKARAQRSWPKLVLSPEQQAVTLRPSCTSSTSYTQSSSEDSLATNIATATKVSPTQEIGYAYEEKAIALLQDQGLVLLARNLRCPLGEIDVIMRDDKVLIFIEIRHRRHAGFGGAAASITSAKLLRLQRAANYFLPQLSRLFFQSKIPYCRFDAIAFENDGAELIWLKNIMQ